MCGSGKNIDKILAHKGISVFRLDIGCSRQTIGLYSHLRSCWETDTFFIICSDERRPTTHLPAQNCKMDTSKWISWLKFCFYRERHVTAYSPAFGIHYVYFVSLFCAVMLEKQALGMTLLQTVMTMRLHIEYPAVFGKLKCFLAIHHNSQVHPGLKW